MNLMTGEEFAVKHINLSPTICEPELSALAREVEVMATLSHKNIVQYLGFDVMHGNMAGLLIFQEWVPGNSLSSKLRMYGAFSDAMVRLYIRQVLHGLSYLHSNGVAHMDIKCDNLLLDKGGIVKMADFGTAEYMSNMVGEGTRGDGTLGRWGTPLFMAPEVLLRREYTFSADVWSIGGAALQMATLRSPWAQLGFRTPVQLSSHMQSTQQPPQIPSGLQPQLRKFLQRCFAWEPTSRPSVDDLLQDPYMASDSGSSSSVSLADLGLHTQATQSCIKSTIRRHMNRPRANLDTNQMRRTSRPRRKKATSLDLGMNMNYLGIETSHHNLARHHARSHASKYSSRSISSVASPSSSDYNSTSDMGSTSTYSLNPFGQGRSPQLPPRQDRGEDCASPSDASPSDGSGLHYSHHLGRCITPPGSGAEEEQSTIEATPPVRALTASSKIRTRRHSSGSGACPNPRAFVDLLEQQQAKQRLLESSDSSDARGREAQKEGSASFGSEMGGGNPAETGGSAPTGGRNSSTSPCTDAEGSTSTTGERNQEHTNGRKRLEQEERGRRQGITV
ncbi:unnamed protein product [Chrysoparadoxa australica]